MPGTIILWITPLHSSNSKSVIWCSKCSCGKRKIRQKFRGEDSRKRKTAADDFHAGSVDYVLGGSVCRRKCRSDRDAEMCIRDSSSIVLTGALLGRLGQASFCDPGGCVIGDRPIDLHLKAFARFGCQIRREDDNFLTVFAKRLNGVQIRFPFSSVGATQNAILCAVLSLIHI